MNVKQFEAETVRDCLKLVRNALDVAGLKERKRQDGQLPSTNRLKITGQ